VHLPVSQENDDMPVSGKVGDSSEAEALTSGELRGEVQLQIFHSKLVLARARELMEALLVVAQRSRV
jgi:hypothetical protein